MRSVCVSLRWCMIIEYISPKLTRAPREEEGVEGQQSKVFVLTRGMSRSSCSPVSPVHFSPQLSTQELTATLLKAPSYSQLVVLLAKWGLNNLGGSIFYTFRGHSQAGKSRALRRYGESTKKKLSQKSRPPAPCTVARTANWTNMSARFIPTSGAPPRTPCARSPERQRVERG